MSNFLAIDTSSRYLTVLARKGDKKKLVHLKDCAMKHSCVLMGEIQRAMDAVGLKPDECDFFCAVTGPGSFTGIRIGVATAKGFAVGADKPVRAVTTFDLIAYNVNSENFYTVIDAAHGYYYVCGYGGGKITMPPSYISRSEVEKLSPLFGTEDLDLENYTRLNAGDCLESAVNGSRDTEISELRALYVRKSQAEEGRK
ncbi:MAG: tRNA (adenosine(37)-N6)-threonylcarbamoyltransferase complex dimerization subunit type 1 TsaB [Clostridia bacterium]|nr:tRNA (adenosine(37)-N6)-threonylcarbamoyltransferase complex dimerization subunit type 1 TsaB [Clostridia bacterium]